MSDFFNASDFYDIPPRLDGFLDQANRLLKERGTVVYSNENQNPGINGWHELSIGFGVPDTHQALLIQIQPIEKPDSAETLVKDLANHAKFDMASLAPNYWIERAKKLLGDK